MPPILLAPEACERWHKELKMTVLRCYLLQQPSHVATANAATNKTHSAYANDAASHDHTANAIDATAIAMLACCMLLLLVFAALHLLVPAVLDSPAAGAAALVRN